MCSISCKNTTFQPIFLQKKKKKKEGARKKEVILVEFQYISWKWNHWKRIWEKLQFFSNYLCTSNLYNVPNVDNSSKFAVISFMSNFERQKFQFWEKIRHENCLNCKFGHFQRWKNSILTNFDQWKKYTFAKTSCLQKDQIFDFLQTLQSKNWKLLISIFQYLFSLISDSWRLNHSHTLSVSFSLISDSFQSHSVSFQTHSISCQTQD